MTVKTSMTAPTETVEDREPQGTDSHLGGVLGQHVLYQVRHDPAVVINQAAVTEVVMGLVQPSETT